MNIHSTHTINGKQYDLMEDPDRKVVSCEKCAFLHDHPTCEAAPPCWTGTFKVFVESQTKETA